MDVPSLVLVMAALLVVVALTEPIARAVRLPSSVVLAGFGVGVGLVATVLIHGGVVPADNATARFFADLPIGSDIFIYVFLPTLLFHSALGMDIHQLAEDGVPVLMLAVIAVVVATLAIGFALWPVAGVSLAACLLLGCIVATTDPVAVIGIFKDVGAPERLVRLVEGESLLNDAAAITMFVVFSALLTSTAAVDGTLVALDFLVIPLGGAVVGVVAGRATAGLIGVVGDNRLVEVSLSLALPYLAYVVAEQLFHLSGVIAVVAAGLTLASAGPARMTPEAWRYLKDIWDQLAFWFSSLIFLLASILIPRLLGGVDAYDVLLLGVVIVASLAARWIILFGVLPLLTAANLSPPVSGDYRLVIFWGGLRGAATLALALAVTENAAMPPEVARFVAVLATGFTLFTLLVQGLTLRPLMRSLRLDRLTAVDQVLRDRAVAVAYAHVADRVADVAARHQLDSAPTADLVEAYRARGASARTAAETTTLLGADDRLALALVAVAGRERELVLQHAGEGTVSQDLVDRLLSQARGFLDAARLKGVAGYRAFAEKRLAFTWRDHLAYRVHARLGIDRFLARRLEDRFELLMETRIVLDQVLPFVEQDVTPVFGTETGDAVRRVLGERRTAVNRAMEALRLQYPDYADALERRFLARVGLALEARHVDSLHENGLVNAEVHRDLARSIAAAQARTAGRLALDLGLDTAVLVARTPLFADFTAEQRAEIARLLKPVVVLPGQTFIRRGEKGETAYFISSGAVSVDTGRSEIRLGRGDIVGEMALLTRLPRSATVTAIGYCSLLALSRRDLDQMLAGHPVLEAHMRRVAEERRRQNIAAVADGP
ncbi:cation:proton antiporter [Chthonobacter rhizosphaerae]|uniref:cation:proton antiporter n=1 Tax=Chthonobacter rhizosphaerae TaxID=2735553 RepID=UPI0015EFD59A|nr:cation:proton antiporter [Chthonobacter rhizosphaerae]